MLNNLKIGARLLFGFTILLVLVMLFGFFSLFQFRKMESFTRQMHEHPMVVSNAVRDIKIDLLMVRTNLTRLTLRDPTLRLEEAEREIYQLYENIDENFALIYDRFLGDMADINTAYEAYSQMIERNKELFRELDYQENIPMDLEGLDRRNQSMSEALNRVEAMSDFAAGKSEELYDNAIEQNSGTFKITIAFLALVILLGILIALFISRSVTAPLDILIGHVQALSIGNQEGDITITSRDEIGSLSDSLREMQTNLKVVSSHAKKIAHGDYSGEIPPRSDKDEMALSLNQMTRALDDLKKKNERSSWIKNGQNLLNDVMRGDKESPQLASDIVSTLAKHLNAQVGVVYLYEDKRLQLLGSFAHEQRKENQSSFTLGEGIAGQAALEKRAILVSKVPEDYIRISSSLGDSQPRNLIAFPFLLNDELKGVIELASLEEWGTKELDFLDQIGETIAMGFYSSQSRKNMAKLLETQQVQSQELQVQQEELRAANEELEEKTEGLIQSEERLKQQQEELRATNEELEEKTEYLETQSTEIKRKNRELELIRDEITQKAKELEESSRYKSEFLANMSHELRTPLNSLLILAKDLMENRRGGLNNDELQSAKVIYNSGSELLILINEILDLAKIESGKMQIQPKDFSLKDVIQNMKNLFESQAKEKGISFLTEIVPNAPEKVHTDPQKLQQIIKNLLSNAIKFTKEGSVTLKIQGVEPSFVPPALFGQKVFSIDVIDTGIGIAPHQIKHIFEAFKQADGSTSRDYGGTGLGLSISRELARFLGGEIDLESTLGEGSHFKLLLPVNLKSTENLELLSSKEIPSSHSEDRAAAEDFIEDDSSQMEEGDNIILIIEDDSNFAAILRDSCRERGFKVLATDHGEKGVELAVQKRPQAILLDIHLPGMDGLQVLDRLKRNRSTRHIPVHVLSADDYKDEIQDKGIVGFLQKPVDRKELDQLFNQIQYLIEKKVKDLLIVEDDANLRFSIEKLIGNSDVKKTSVSTGKEALKLLKDRQFDCMVLDLSLPDMSGKDILKKMEAMDLDPKPPTIIYTGREISYEEEFELRQYARSIIIKGVQSQERLLDETALFLHRVVKELPESKQAMISKIYDEEAVFNDKTILIADDDMRNVFALSKIIEDRGMSVEKAANGKKALEILERRNTDIDLILMDIMMPVMDGYQAMEEIRRNRHWESIPILALTAKAMKEDREKCIASGANDYMTKPIDPQRLLSLMRVWLYK